MLTDVENDTGGQVVAGSNPVSPSRKQALTWSFSEIARRTDVRLAPRLSQIVTTRGKRVFKVASTHCSGCLFCDASPLKA